MVAERIENYGLVVLLTAAGLCSGLVTVASRYPAGRFGFLLGAEFGAIMALSLAMRGLTGSLWRTLLLVILSEAAYILSIAGAAAAELHSPGIKWSMGSRSIVSLPSLLAGGAIGGLMVLTSFLLLTRGRTARRPFARTALLGSLTGGILSVIGWVLGPSLGMSIWSGAHALGLTAPTETSLNALLSETSHMYSLYVVWQAGMAFVIGLTLRNYRPKSESRGTQP